MPLPGRLPEGHAVFVAVDGAVLQSDLVHAVSGGGGLCLTLLFSPVAVMFLWSSSYSDLGVRSRRRSTTYSVLYVRKLIPMPPRIVSRRVLLKQHGTARGGAVSRALTFLGRAGTSGVSEVKKKGGAHHSSGPVLFPIFLTALLATCSLTRGKVSVGMFRDRSDPLTDYLRKARRRYARTAERFT